MRSMVSETQLLERSWTLQNCEVSQGGWWLAVVGLLLAPQLRRHILEFTLVSERVTSLHLQVGDRIPTDICVYGGCYSWATSMLDWAKTLTPGGAGLGGTAGLI